MVRELSREPGVPKTVLLVNRAFVPPEKGVFDENGENDESAF